MLTEDPCVLRPESLEILEGKRHGRRKDNMLKRNKLFMQAT